MSPPEFLQCCYQTQADPSSEVINSTFSLQGFYGNNTKTQLGLIHARPLSPWPRAEPAACCRGTDKQRLPIQHKHQSSWCLTRYSGAAISHLSATLTRSEPDWNKPIIIGSFLVLWALKLTLGVSMVFFPWKFGVVFWRSPEAEAPWIRDAESKPFILVLLVTGSNSPYCQHFPLSVVVSLC